jgi:fructose-bisphosphate aldolase class II
MHGSSSVPEALQDLVNAHGGAIRPTWGVPLDEIVRGIRHGVRKVNIDTDLRLAATGAIRRALSLYPAAFDPRGYLKAAMIEMEGVCIERFEAFGTAGHADGLRVQPLEAMARNYAVAA